jgi:peptide/nickel transport system ATP-binding protein
VISPPILDIRGVSKFFPLRRSLWDRLAPGKKPLAVGALRDLDFSIATGETMAVVGESGCGKSTLARVVMGLIPPSAGTVVFEGTPIDAAGGPGARARRRHIQMVFQNPFGSLDPRMRVRALVREPLVIHRRALGLSSAQIRARVEETLFECGLDPAMAGRFPHQFSGGQRQRIAIARALAIRPSMLVLDEPVSALDVSVQAQIVNLLREKQRDHDLTYLFISHDLSLVRCFATRVVVMYLGRVCEIGEIADVFDRPLHPYTRGLLAAVPDIRARSKRPAAVPGELPNPIRPPSGCAFHPRCPLAFDRCRTEEPTLTKHPQGQLVACHLVTTSDDRPQ